MTDGLDPADVAAVRALARASRMIERASGELSLAHYRVLGAIATGERRASRVAQRLALGKPTVSAAVESLCQRGLLARETGDPDQRVVVLRATEAGLARLAEVDEAVVDRLRALREQIPGGEHLIESLVWLGKAIEETVAAKVTEQHGGSR